MKQKLTICTLALLTSCLVSPAALANTASPDANQNNNASNCQAQNKKTDCTRLAQNAGKPASGGTSAALPAPAATPPAPPPAAEAPPAPPPAPEIPAALLVPFSQSEISIGGQWVGGHNTGQAGRYTGFTNGGLDLLFDFSTLQRSGWNSGDTHYFSFSGTNLDIQTGNRLANGFRDNAYANGTHNKLGPNAELSLSLGEQGKWGITADYSATTYTGNVISSLWTIDGATGTLNNGLLPYGGASNNPLTAGTVKSWTPATLTPYFEQVQTGTRRDKVEVGGKFEMDEWTFATNIQHEHKQGTLEESIRQTYGGMAFTLPANYDTDRFDLSASYVDPDYQALIQYTYSRFTDNNEGVTLPYVVSISALSATSGPYAQRALYSTPPSNSAHYLTVMLSDKLAPQTRVVFNGRVGLELQDDTFPANSADPNLSPALGNPTYSWFANYNGMNQGTSAPSLNASAFVYQGSLSLSTELAEHLDGRATYSVDGRDVNINQYKVWFGAASLDATANSFAYSVVQNWFKQKANVELGYLVLPESNTKVTFNYTFDNTNRTNAQVEHSITNTESLGVSSMIGKDLMARLTYEHGNRNGTLVYGTAWGNLEAGAPEADGTPSGAYYQAPMSSDSLVLRVDYAPVGDFSGGLFFKAVDNHYTYPQVESAPTPTNAGDWNLVGHGEGITHDSNLTVGPDISYRPSNDINLHVYYTYERIFFDNRGNGACAESNTGNCAGSAGYFKNTYTSSMHTAGFSGDWRVTDKLKLSGEYNLSVGSVIFGEYNGVIVSPVTATYQSVTPYPDINSRMDDVKASLIYAFSDSVEGSLIYRYSMFNNNDWQYIPAPVVATNASATAISIVNAGYGPPNYNVSSVGMVVRVKL